MSLIFSWDLAVEIFLRVFELLSALPINSLLVLFYLRESELQSVAHNLQTLINSPLI